MGIIRQYRIFKVLFCSFCCVICINLTAQRTCYLYVEPVDTIQYKLLKIKLAQVFPSRKNCIQYVEQLPDMLRAKGYLSASVDSVMEDTASLTIHLFTGKQYTWKYLSLDNSTTTILNDFHCNVTEISSQPYSQEIVDAIYSKVLDFYQNRGYPFAKVGLDSLVLEDSTISARLMVDKSIPYFIDSIHIVGKLKLSQEFIHRYLDIAPHELYNAAKLEKINSRLAELTYLQQKEPWSLLMLNDRAILNLYLEPKQSNAIDVIAGFLPASDQTGGKLLLTGQATINLKNAFATGETIGVNWQQLQARSPRLNLLFQRPYLFHSPLGIRFNFELYKRDSFFVNISSNIGLQYAFSSRNTGTLFLQTTSSRLLSVDTTAVIVTKTLPATGDLNSVSLGIDYRMNHTDYETNPRRGTETLFYHQRRQQTGAEKQCHYGD